MRQRLIVVLAAVVTATAAASAACSSSETGTGSELSSGFEKVSGSPADFFKRLSLDSARYDGMMFREVSDGVVGADGGKPTCSPATPLQPLREETLGNLCGGAPDAALCAKELACKTTPDGWSTSGNRALQHTYVITGKAGALGFVTNRDQLIAVLGRIDALPKALFLVALDVGYRTTIVGSRTVTGGFELQLTGGGSCTTEPAFERIVRVTADGTVSEISKRSLQATIPPCAEGRRPAGLRDCPVGGIGLGAAAYLAEAAHLEAAAVVAFDEMARTLRRLGAPKRLVLGAERARADEVRHARAMGRLARARGATPKAVVVEPHAPHTLESLAVENVVEGCVRETYAVARAMWQATHAGDASIAAALAVVAREEATHAELSWAVAEWLDTGLDAAARARVRAARDAALGDLRRELEGEPHAEVVRDAGMPGARVALRLFDEMVERLELSAAA